MAAPGRGQDMLVCVIADEDTVAGFLMAGVGHHDKHGQNFLVVRADTAVSKVAEAFERFTTRTDAAVVLISQSIASQIRHVMSKHTNPVPVVLELPDRTHPYDPAKDPIMKRVTAVSGPAK